MTLKFSRINIFTGHYGSGKTEVAVNFAFHLKELGKQVTIVDLDIVNPYFRTKDAEKPLTDAGIKVISPTFANTNLDLPSLPSSIQSVFHDKERIVIFDVGGDDDGAVALGRYNSYFKAEDITMFLVINPNRPLNKTSDEIIETMHAIENISRLKVNYIVNNSNLMQYTTPNTINDGQKILDEVSKKTSIKTAFISTKENIASNYINNEIEILRLKLYLKPKWFEE